MSEQPLLQQFDTLEDLGIFKYEPKAYVVENLNPNLILRPYQEKAIARFEYSQGLFSVLCKLCDKLYSLSVCYQRSR